MKAAQYTVRRAVWLAVVLWVGVIGVMPEMRGAPEGNEAALPSPKRGAIPTPVDLIKSAARYTPRIALQLDRDFIFKPKVIRWWGNDEYADCVTAEEAFAKACDPGTVAISDYEAITWARKHQALNSARLPDVLGWMRNDGFVQGAVQFNDGPALYVDWKNAGALRDAISQGPVKIGLKSEQLEKAWEKNGRRSGWIAMGFTAESGLYHCVSLYGYGSMAWLAQQMNVSLPAGVDGTQPGYAMFTWNSVGIIEASSLLAVTNEAWVRQPTTVTKP